MLKKRALIMLVTMVAANSFAAGMLDASTPKASQDAKLAVMRLESAFTPTVSSVTLVKTNNNVNWSDSGLQVSINNQWQITIKSKAPIHLVKIKVGIDNDAIENRVDLTIKPGDPAKYLFASQEFETNIKAITAGQTVLGIVQNLDIDDYHGYKWYAFKKFNVTLTYVDGHKNFNETSSRFFMVLGR